MSAKVIWPPETVIPVPTLKEGGGLYVRSVNPNALTSDVKLNAVGIWFAVLSDNPKSRPVTLPPKCSLPKMSTLGSSLKENANVRACALQGADHSERQHPIQ